MIKEREKDETISKQFKYAYMNVCFERKNSDSLLWWPHTNFSDNQKHELRILLFSSNFLYITNRTRDLRLNICKRISLFPEFGKSFQLIQR